MPGGGSGQAQAAARPGAGSKVSMEYVRLIVTGARAHAQGGKPTTPQGLAAIL